MDTTYWLKQQAETDIDQHRQQENSNDLHRLLETSKWLLESSIVCCRASEINVYYQWLQFTEVISVISRQSIYLR